MFHTFVTIFSDPTLFLYPDHFGDAGAFGVGQEVAAATATSFSLGFIRNYMLNETCAFF